jgi:hypothetical protein
MIGAMPTLAVGMLWDFLANLMPTASVGMAPIIIRQIYSEIPSI